MTDAKATADLDKVTDYFDEKELDANKVEAALKELQEQTAASDKEAIAREKALAAVKVRQEDVDVVIKEFEFSKAAADRALRENDGDLKRCLVSLINA
eukprot:GFYU01007846.1.p1 GENE.GFYU01007846.1~~GFYU01007846.1.p1  ORF type:complete len:112 (-),score=35.70 GFYU01007846.1:274-567(-)